MNMTLADAGARAVRCDIAPTRFARIDGEGYFTIDADCSREDVEALIAQSQKRSAVFDVVTNPTKVLVELA